MSGKLSKRLVSLTVVLSLFTPSVSQIAKADEAESEVASTDIVFGAAYPMTGVSSPGMSSYYKGINAYFAHVNENGGIYGKKIRLLERDSQGIPTLTINASNILLLKDNVFGFLSSAPTCASHIAFLRTLRLADRGVSDILSDCNITSTISSEEEPSTNSVSTTSYNKLDNDAENLILKSLIDSNFGEKRIALIYQDDDFGISATKIFRSDKIICKKAFLQGSEQIFAPNCNSTSTPLRNGDLVVYAGSPTGLMGAISTYSSQNLTLSYFANYDAYNPQVLAFRANFTSLADIYTVSHNALVSDQSNEAVATFSAIARKYAQSNEINQRFLNGMNSAYLVANVVAAVGPDLTRTRFQQALLQFGNQFDALGLSDRSSLATTPLTPTGGVVVKYLGNTGQVVSDMFVVSNGLVSQRNRKATKIYPGGLPISTQLLAASAPTQTPSPTPTPTPTPTVKPTPTPTPTATVKPTPTPEPIVEIDGEDEEPFGKISAKREKTKYTISISSNLPEEPLQVRATKKGQKSIIFKVTTNDQGAAKFTTTRALAGFQLVLLLDGEILSSVKAG
jgi:ABC-type branched-subunit amino acid transport system substrate-binding protein